MQTKLPHEHKKFGNFNWLITVFIIVIAIAIAVYIKISGGNANKFMVIKISNSDEHYNLSKLYSLGSFEGDTVKGSALLAEKGDLLVAGDFAYYVSDIKPDSLHFESGNSNTLVYLNGKIHSIIIDDSSRLLPWFKKMQDSDIAALQSITIESKISDEYFTYLQKIAAIKPNTSFLFEKNDSSIFTTDFSRITKLFTPTFIVAPLSQQQFPLLAACRGLSLLYLSDDADAAITAPLPAIPSLKECILLAENAAVDKDFFRNNPQLERLTAVTKNRFGYLESLQHLSELNIITDSPDIKQITQQCKNLEVLNITSTESFHIDALDSLQQLKWLGLPENVPQASFDSVILSHPSLEVVELNGNDSLKSLQALTQLTKLGGLVIMDTLTDMKTLYSLKQLRYLSLPKENFKDSAEIAALQKALPGCIIVPNSGACLASGWLLLLIPITFLFSILIKNRSSFKNIHRQINES